MSESEKINLQLRAVKGEQSELDEAWTVKDVCAFLRMGKTWVYEQVERNAPGGLPFKRIGSRVRFSALEVRLWWAQQGAK